MEVFYTDDGLNVCATCARARTIVDGNEGYPEFVCEACGSHGEENA